MTTAEKRLFYVGTFTRGREEEGVFLCSLDTSTGQVEVVRGFQAGDDPAFMALHPNGRLLYAVSEVAEFRGERAGGVTALSVDPATGDLSIINQESSRGPGPCHLTVDATGRWVLVANYIGGSVAVLPVKEDGSLGPATDFKQHRGKGANPQRQEAPHAHSVNMDPQNRFAYVCDLGLDRVMIYALDGERGTLSPAPRPFAQVAPGSGPRHFTFHPNGRFAYLINELACTITVFAHDPQTGGLDEVQTVSTLPEGQAVEPNFTTADIHVHPSGRFLYGSNRGHDTIAIFAVDADTGRLTPIGHESTRGRTPRNFALDPTGTFLLAENQDTDNVVVFRIDQEKGTLKFTGHQVEVPRPVCIVFWR